jgi:hypothetical protein
VFIVDKSAWTRARDPRVRDEWSAALLGRQLATCAIVKLEILWSAQNVAEFEGWDEGLGELRQVPVTDSACRAAIEAMNKLAAKSDKAQRSVAIPDFLIAATAQDAALGVLHYDKDFDVLQEFLEFDSRWIAPKGTF